MLCLGTCGSGNPYYLLCSTCRYRYKYDSISRPDPPVTGSESPTGCPLPYAKLLQVAPDLLGSGNKKKIGELNLYYIFFVHIFLCGKLC